VLFVSGYSSEGVPVGEGSPSTSAYLQKPFTRAELLARVRELLEARLPAAGPA
jgi:DNA-binding response OmpR family regulator